MRLALDRYAHLDSPLHRWDPRFRIPALLALAFAFAFVKDLRLVPVILLVSLALCALSRLPVPFLWSRLGYPGLFVLALGVVLPFFSGETVLADLGPLAVREEGSLAFLLIVSRFTAIVLVCLVAFSTSTMRENIAALRSLGVPALLTDLALFTYRYLDELGDSLSRMRRATRLRGFTGARLGANLSTFASLLGSLLVRSHERSERVYHAMVLRGYGSEATEASENAVRPRAADVAALLAALLAAVLLTAAQVTLG